MTAIKHSRTGGRLATAALVLGCFTVGTPQGALARSSSLLPYPLGEVWPTAIRFLRIDRGATLKEKDLDSGYVLFELPEGGKAWKGSLELVRTADPEGRDATRVVVNLNDLPRHYEGVLLDKLAIKLKEEYGSPAPAPPRRPPGDSGKAETSKADGSKNDRPRDGKGDGKEDGKEDSKGDRKPAGDGLPRIPTVELPRPAPTGSGR